MPVGCVFHNAAQDFSTLIPKSVYMAKGQGSAVLLQNPQKKPAALAILYS